jgi:hypothetical protein
MELGRITQQALDLNHFLFDRPLHPELFRHYADYRIGQGRYQAEFWLVGLSHVVTVTSGPRCLTELIAPESDDLPQRGLVTRFRLKGERDHERRCPNGWFYMISSQVETMEEHLFKSVHSDLLRHAQKRGWLHQFKEWAEGDMAPFTYIDHEARDAELHVYAYHTFPAERTLVKTQSIFELSKT